MGISITTISDTHGKHHQLNLDDDSSVLIHAGDIEARTEWDLRDFLEWFEMQDYEYKVFVAGNHDFYLQRPDARQIVELYQVEYLQDEDISINGIRIWGSPWSLPFMNWAFMQSDEKLDKVYSDVPEDIDIFVNHGAPKHILDTYDGIVTGSESFANHAKRVSPEYCVFGHIHENGQKIIINDDVRYVNSSVLDSKYNLISKKGMNFSFEK